MTQLVTAEFRKVLGLRYWWILGIAPVLVGVFCGALSLPVFRYVENFVGKDSAGAAAAGVGIAFALALVFLFAALFGVVNTGSEYQHRTFVTSFLTAPGRDRVIAAKFVTVALFGLAYCLVVEVTAAAAVIMFGGGFDGSVAGEVVAVLAVGLICAALWALIGSGLGLLTGSTAGSIVAVCVWVPFGEMIVSLILHGLSIGGLAQILPVQATSATLIGILADEQSDGVLPWPAAPFVVIVWAVVICALGWWRTRTRDFT